MSFNNLQGLIENAGDPLTFLRSTKYHRREDPSFTPPLIIPQIPYEFTGWEREQNAWREAVALMDQSHHMHASIVSGPDAKAFLSYLACNNLANSNPSRAFQIICAGPDGNMIGDGILFQTAESEFSAVGPFLVNWLAYHAAILDFDVEVSTDARSPVYANGHANSRPECRYQIQGPHAWALIEKLNRGPIVDVPFFHVTSMEIDGIRMGALRHGMAGTPGLEIWGPWERRDHIRDTILKEGEEFGIVEVGAAAYCSSGIESGWLQGVLPAIYSSDETKAYRERLKPNDLEALVRLTGSQDRPLADDFYRTPFDIGYGRFIHFDHEFIGRDALLQRSKEPSLQKVTLAWHPEDAGRLLQQMTDPDGHDIKMLHLPVVNDKLEFNYTKMTHGGREAGTAHYTAYLATERAMLTLSLVDADLKMGDEVTIHWGEIGGGLPQFQTPATDSFSIRAVVSPAPYSRVAREEYRC